MSKPNVLLIDDDPSFCLAMSKALRRRGFEVHVVQESDLAVRALREASTETVAVLDLKMPKRSGLEVLRETLPQRRAPVLMLTGHGAVPEAVEAMKAGAYTFLTKPIDAADLEPMILQAHSGRARSVDVAEFVGASEVARQVRSLTHRLAEVRAPILITGETGTGKEVVARTLHAQSDRANSPFIAINMASLSQRDFEAELFGRARQEGAPLSPSLAAFDSSHQYQGLLTEVGQGTLFLDEIDELSLEHQVKLLRLVEDRTYRPVGGGELKRFEGRLIASTHQPLERLVVTRSFREDLFHRLNVYPINLPPLNERDDDAALILRYWLKRLTGLEVRFDHETQLALTSHLWRGNAREVVNLARRASVLCLPSTSECPSPLEGIIVSYQEISPLLDHQLFSGPHSIGSVSRSPSYSDDERLSPPLSEDHQATDSLPKQESTPTAESGQLESIESQTGSTGSHSQGDSLEMKLDLIGGDFSLEDIERAHILKLVERHGNLSQVARILNVNRRTLQRKLKIWND